MKTAKNIIIKILLTIGVFILGMVLQAAIHESGTTTSAGIRLIPGFVLIVGLIFVWTRKFNQ